MKLVLRILVLMAISPAAFAGGGGSMSCNLDEQVVAVYTFFHSIADSYSVAHVFVQDPATGEFAHYTESNESALKPVKLKLKDGRNVVVAADKKSLEFCTIKIDEARR